MMIEPSSSGRDIVLDDMPGGMDAANAWLAWEHGGHVLGCANVAAEALEDGVISVRALEHDAEALARAGAREQNGVIDEQTVVDAWQAFRRYPQTGNNATHSVRMLEGV
jgi:hypothetical protein